MLLFWVGGLQSTWEPLEHAGQGVWVRSLSAVGKTSLAKIEAPTMRQECVSDIVYSPGKQCGLARIKSSLDRKPCITSGVPILPSATIGPVIMKV